MNLLLPHGPISCRLCFPAGRDRVERDGWRLDNNPGAWGARDPLVLVLGFSKGATQADICRRGNFDDIPFARARDRLTRVLRTLRVLACDDVLDNHIRAEESDLAFGSLLRCGLSFRDRRSNQFTTSGALIKRAFDQSFPAQSLSICARSYLAALPPRLRLVVMLGSDTGYVERCASLIGQLGAGPTTRLNEVAYQRGAETFVHVAHPSPANGHFKSWEHGDAATGPGRKRELALVAVSSSRLALPVAGRKACQLNLPGPREA